MVDEKHTQVLELLPAYVLDSLDESETVLVSEHLALCSACRAEARAFEAVAEQLPLAIAGVSPPPDLHERLLARVSATSAASIPSAGVEPGLDRRRNPGRFGRLSLSYTQLAMLVLILILLASNLFLWQRVNRLTLTTGPDRMQAIRLVTTGYLPEANGFILVSADGLSGAVVVDELPMLAEEQQYQLWLERNGKSASGALLSVDELGYGGARITPPQPLFHYTAASITVEPAGGSPNPTGDPVLTASLFAP